MNRDKILASMLIIFLAGCSGNLARTNPLDPQNSETQTGGRINGTVFMVANPISNAEVTTSPATQTVFTDPTGIYSIDNIPPGSYILSARAPWMINIPSTAVQILAGSLVNKELNMKYNNILETNFEDWSLGPWSASALGSSSGILNNIAGGFNSVNCVQISCSSGPGDYGAIDWQLPANAQDFRFIAMIKTNSATARTGLNVYDSIGTPLIEFGFAGGAAGYHPVLYTVAHEEEVITSVTLTADTYYEFFCEAKAGLNEVVIFLKSISGSSIYNTTTPIYSGYFPPFSKVSYRTKESGGQGGMGYVDEISIIQK